jgi:hypothetical protein
MIKTKNSFLKDKKNRRILKNTRLFKCYHKSRTRPLSNATPSYPIEVDPMKKDKANVKTNTTKVYHE